MRQKALNHLVVAHWGLFGTATKGQPNYRSQNPWQALEHYMEGKRGDSATFLASHGARPRTIDRGGTVWTVTLDVVPTPAGYAIDDFAHALLDKLIAQNTLPDPNDLIWVTYADDSHLGRWEWP